MTPSPHPEQQYLDLLSDLLKAPERPDRTGVGTRGVFGRRMEFDLSDGFPLLTTKKLPFSVIVHELLWMLSGSTNVRDLQKHGVTIWDEWADEDGELGPIYGKQWRSWENYPFPNIDQVANVLTSLREDPYGRRHIVTAWNPAEIDDMALPPCHCFFQFYVEADGRLSLQLYQRSADAFLGLPFNIASYALLLSMFAAALGRPRGRFVWTGGDVHLYANHVDQARQQTRRQPYPLPILAVDAAAVRDGMDSWTVSDFMLFDYDPWPHIPAPVAV